MNRPLVAIQNLSKRYGGVQALDRVSLDMAAGEIHALCGENGAGKSTLIKILAGSVLPDEGSVLVDGQPLDLGNVAAAEAAGIAVIHQESVAFPHLSVPENIFVGREPRRFGGWWLDRRRMRAGSQALLDRLGERLNLSLPVGLLPLAQRQMVAIARALSRQCRLLVMDEPTASLSARETAVLFRVIRQMRDAGVSVLYVSHHLEEIFELADRVTVLRDGRWVATQPTRELDKSAVIRLMVGRDLTPLPGREGLGEGQTAADQTPFELNPNAEKPLLEVRSLHRERTFHDISFEVRAGEIVGMAGLVGAGRSEVARAIFGIDTPDSGTIRVAGKPVSPGSVTTAIARGIALVPEDRQHQGLVLPMSVSVNLTLAVLRQIAHWGLISKSCQRLLVDRLIREFTIRAASPSVPAQTLSGGNQQKLVLAKWLAAKPRVLILDEPTRGVDVGAKAEIYRLIRALSAEGIATLLISSELPEILALADRILVMRDGRISGELASAAATQEKILALAVPMTSAAEI